MLPNILYAAEIIIFSEQDLEKLQRTDNSAYRNILQLPIYTATEFLRGDVGASSTKARDIKSKLLFIKHAIRSDGNKLLCQLMCNELEKKQLKWTKDIFKQMEKVGITINDVKQMKINMLKKKIIEWDENIWRNNMERKSSLLLYRNNKNKMNEEKWFKNGNKYEIMMKARSNSLKLGKRDWENHDNICKMCNEGEETLQHFIISCISLNDTRISFIQLQRPHNENIEDIIKKVLLFEQDSEFSTEYYIDLVYKLWIHRKRLINEIPEEDI